MFATADPIVLQSLTMHFDDDGWKCHHSESIDEMIKPLATGSMVVAVICESMLNDKKDFCRLQEIIKQNPLTAIIALVDQPDNDAARALTNEEPFDTFTKPLTPKAILLRAYDAVAELLGS
ncbi:MAG: DNA-binding NtrC family response regulator [Verrucomicrobiales bacterium]